KNILWANKKPGGPGYWQKNLMFYAKRGVVLAATELAHWATVTPGPMPANLEIIPTDAALAAEVRGLDLSEPMDDRTFAVIEHAYDEYGVLFFRDQRITPDQQVDFTRRFGEIEFNIFGERWSVPGCPEIVVVSNITDNGKPIGIRRAGENWHSDMCYAPRPPRGTMLYAQEIPTLHGLPLGDTEFASAAAAWYALPATMQRFLDGRRAVFDFRGRKR